MEINLNEAAGFINTMMADRGIVVTGANGQLGKCIEDIAVNYPGAKFHFLDRTQCDIGNPEAAGAVIRGINPFVVINAAAYTAVDKAENDAETAALINAGAVANLAKICSAIGARFIHVSTDYVFDGTQTKPYRETDATNPINVYGKTKLSGEEAAQLFCDQSVIVRTSWVYSRHGNNFVKTMLRLMGSRESIGVVNDQFGCPTYAIDLADALVRIAYSRNFVPGIYHYSNAGAISWWQFANAIRAMKQLPCVVNPISTAEFPTPAKRPVNSVMGCQKMEMIYGIQQWPWQESLEACLELL